MAKTFDELMANLNEDQRGELSAVRPLVEQYCAEADYLLREGISLAVYVEAGVRDTGDEVRDDLKQTLARCEAEFGAPFSPKNWLAGGGGQTTELLA